MPCHVIHYEILMLWQEVLTSRWSMTRFLSSSWYENDQHYRMPFIPGCLSVISSLVKGLYLLGSKVHLTTVTTSLCDSLTVTYIDLIVTAIHMTVTAVWYDMTNDSERLMTMTVLTQWDAWQIEFDMWIDEASWAEVNEQRLTRDSWAAVSSVEDGQMSMSWDSWQQETSDWWDDVTVSFNVNASLTCIWG